VERELLLVTRALEAFRHCGPRKRSFSRFVLRRGSGTRVLLVGSADSLLASGRGKSATASRQSFVFARRVADPQLGRHYFYCFFFCSSAVCECGICDFTSGPVAWHCGNPARWWKFRYSLSRDETESEAGIGFCWEPRKAALRPALFSLVFVVPFVWLSLLRAAHQAFGVYRSGEKAPMAVVVILFSASFLAEMTTSRALAIDFYASEPLHYLFNLVMGSASQER